jgi:hypothetical protein
MFLGYALDPSLHGFHEAGTIPMNPWLGAPWNSLLINALITAGNLCVGLVNTSV